MASFKALNLESDDESDNEIDDTKEIQVEDALRDYQNALKLHAQGSKSYEEADQAYEVLFKSEIFKYPESQSEFKRAQALASRSDYVVDYVYEQSDGPQPQTESARGTLPQLLHLAYKNRGQLSLDRLQHALKQKRTGTSGAETEGMDGTIVVAATPQTDVKTAAMAALDDFAEALDKDEEDIDLWRRASKVGGHLGSSTIARYCMEAALEGDDEDTDEILGGPSIEAALVKQDLQRLEQLIQDDLVRARPGTRLASTVPPPILKTHLELFPFLPARSTKRLDDLNIQTERENLVITEESWTALGRALLGRLESESYGESTGQPGSAIGFKLERGAISSPRLNRRKSSTPFVKPQLSDRPSSDKETSVSALPTATGSADTEVELTESQIKSEVAVEDPKPADEATSIASLPSRKRSLAQTDLPDGGDGGRGRSKRIRARESNADGAIVDAAGNRYTTMEWQLFYPIEADRFLFNVLDGMTKKLGIDSFTGAQGLRRLITGDGGPTEMTAVAENNRLLPALKTFYSSMLSWGRQKNQWLAANSDGGESAIDTRHAGLMAFLDSAASKNQRSLPDDESVGVQTFIDAVNSKWLNVVDASQLWLLCLLDAQQGKTVGNAGADGRSSYLSRIWSEALKKTVDEVLSAVDEQLYSSMSALCDHFIGRTSSDRLSDDENSLVNTILTVFELHLDSYTQLTSPTSSADTSARQARRISLTRWCNLARDCFSTYADANEITHGDVLLVRYFWASAFHLQTLEEVPREQVILCIDDVKRLLRSLPDQTILLPNNISMPELSATAADRELSKLETMDFFLSIFNAVESDPVSLIEKLEPILMSTVSLDKTSKDSGSNVDEGQEPAATTSHSTLEVLSKFVENASTPLRLNLWRRLREAYQSIDYPPKVFIIELRSLRTILGDLTSPSFAVLKGEKRERKVLACMRECEEPLKQALSLAESSDNPFECVDHDELVIAFRTVSDLWMMLHGVSLFDDFAEVTVKEKQMMNPFRVYPSDSFHKASILFHDMQVRIIMLWYLLLKEATVQYPEQFSPGLDFRLEYLRNVHHVLGMRRLCKASDSLFLNFMKKELENLTKEGMLCSDDYSQVLFDLFDLNCFVNPQEKQDHGCEPDYLERATAMELVDFVFDKAKAVNAKDWLKSEIVKSVEKLNDALGPIRASYAAARNKKIYEAYLKSPLNPLELYRCLQGLDDLSAVPVSVEEAPLAAKGWFFLRGQIEMAKYRAARAKATQVSDEDLQEATSLFSSDLEFSPERWESWLGLALAHDAQLEEKVLWSAEDLNVKRPEVSGSERAAVHAYAMAVSMAMRNAELTEETSSKLAELYSNFGTRIYASSRPPFDMYAFSLADFPEKHCSSESVGGGLYTRRPFKSLTSVRAWKFAAALFRSAIEDKPNAWTNHYMLGKCLWKLRNSKGSDDSMATEALGAFLKAVDTLPDRKESRGQDPILEPIFKAVSILDKLMRESKLDDPAGASAIEEILRKQSQIDISRIPLRADFETWNDYLLEVLKILRGADKAKWHHRIVMKIARTMYEKHGQGEEAARLTKEYLLDQHLYSAKTMALTVWKPENERPGRHWAFMSKYALFLTELLEKTMDLEAIQLLVRRVRKKTGDFFNHGHVWEQVCLAHLRMHRQQGQIKESLDAEVFDGVPFEDFAPKAAQIDSWCQDADNSHPLLTIMRELVEVKKINQGLIQPPSPIDALIADTYTTIYITIGPTLGPPPPLAAPAPAPTVAPSAPEPVPKLPPTPERINIMSLMNVDGASEGRPTPPPAPAATPVIVPAEPAPRPRFKPVTRRELVKRASEASVQKTAVFPANSKPRASDTGFKQDVKASTPDRATGGVEIESAAASVHDDADDESELSEPPAYEDAEEGDTEEAKPRPMFPNLIRAQEEDQLQSSDIGSSAVQTEDEEEGGDETMHTADEGTPEPSGSRADLDPKGNEDHSDRMDIDGERVT